MGSSNDFTSNSGVSQPSGLVNNYVDEDIEDLTSAIPPPMNVIKADQNSEQQVFQIDISIFSLRNHFKFVKSKH